MRVLRFLSSIIVQTCLAALLFLMNTNSERSAMASSSTIKLATMEWCDGTGMFNWSLQVIHIIYTATEVKLERCF